MDNYGIRRLMDNPSSILMRRLSFLDDLMAPVKTGGVTQYGRPIWQSSDGENYSEKSATFDFDGTYYNVPTVRADGSVMSDDEAADFYGLMPMKIDPITRKKIEGFDNLDDALHAARFRSDNMQHFNNQQQTAGYDVYPPSGLADWLASHGQAPSYGVEPISGLQDWLRKHGGGQPSDEPFPTYEDTDTSSNPVYRPVSGEPSLYDRWLMLLAGDKGR